MDKKDDLNSQIFYIFKHQQIEMVKQNEEFRSSIFQSFSPTIPLVASAAAFISALFIFLTPSETSYLPLQYSYSAMCVSLSAIFFSFYILIWILKERTGSPKMNEVATTILDGSEGFFKQQYGTIFKYALVFSLILSTLYGIRDNPLNLPIKQGTVSNISGFNFSILIGLSFLFGAFCSGCSGFAGMWVSVRTNIRVAQAATSSYNRSLQLAFAGGYFGAAINIALAIFGVSSLFVGFYFYLNSAGVQVMDHLQLIPLLMVGFGFGASFVAMFAQLGGGIYTKAADVGADLVGKLEKDFPEDDERNPAVVADLVGDNVGDCAGQAADLFESITAQIISAMILGGSLAKQAHLGTAATVSFMFFPLALHSLDLISSTIGLFFVKTEDRDENDLEDALDVMKRGYSLALIFGITGFCFICFVFLRSQIFPRSWYLFSLCGIIGAIISYIFVLVTQYYTDYKYSPVQKIAKASQTGHATNIIAGLAVGMQSTGFPVLVISVGVLASFHVGKATGITDLQGNLIGGLFGTAIATMGMFCTGVYVLSMSGFGPIADNAGGIVEMSDLPESVRKITDRLDAVGNVTKANAKGYSVGSAALACFLLFSAFIDEVNMISQVKLKSVDITIPEVFIGGLVGSMTVFIFAAWAIEAVGNAAQDVIIEARRQVTQDVIERKVKPDYTKCVQIVTAAGQREMVKPGLLSVLSPIVISLVFKYIGDITNQPLLGPKAVCAFLMFSTATGILMALFLNNGGGAWDNTKKYCESKGWKKTDVHLSAVTGDTVGDPCKDTAGPSIHILIKLVSTITLVMVPLLV